MTIAINRRTEFGYHKVKSEYELQVSSNLASHHVIIQGVYKVFVQLQTSITCD